MSAVADVRLALTEHSSNCISRRCRGATKRRRAAGRSGKRAGKSHVLTALARELVREREHLTKCSMLMGFYKAAKRELRLIRQIEWLAHYEGLVAPLGSCRALRRRKFFRSPTEQTPSPALATVAGYLVCLHRQVSYPTPLGSLTRDHTHIRNRSGNPAGIIPTRSPGKIAALMID